MTWSERPSYLKECVEICTAFRIEVIVEKSHISKYIVSVNPSIFLYQMRANHIIGEQYILSLIKSINVNKHLKYIYLATHNRL